MSFIEYDGSEVKARYPGSEAVVALPEVGLPDVTSGDVQRGSGMPGASNSLQGWWNMAHLWPLQ
jgi:hypothetical protein